MLCLTFPGAHSPSWWGTEQQGDERTAVELSHMRRCSSQRARSDFLFGGVSDAVDHVHLLKYLKGTGHCPKIMLNFSEHFCAWVEEVIVPLFKNESNICKFPKCLADDIKRQVHMTNSKTQLRYIDIFKKVKSEIQKKLSFTIGNCWNRCTSLQQQCIKSDIWTI